MLNILLPILLFAALGLAVLGALRRVNMWRRGRASKVDLLGGLLAMPKRYMVDLHHVVARDKYIANTSPVLGSKNINYGDTKAVETVTNEFGSTVASV